ncbi:MAG: hypothetical protein GY868_09715, partial [Deltaproteobacteria bacterium]|nr:hypothetical protein [Deltaproteobacteria bacterium]
MTSRNAAPVLQDVSNITAVRVAQRDAKTTRIVLDIAQKIYREDYEISQYFDPARIEIRLRAKNKRRAKRVKQIFKKSAATTTISAPRTLPEKIEPRPEPALQKKAAPVPKKPRAAQLKKTDVPKAKSDSDCIIVIDAGHGGKDPGAIGYKGIMEKDVC